MTFFKYVQYMYIINDIILVLFHINPLLIEEVDKGRNGKS